MAPRSGQAKRMLLGASGLALAALGLVAVPAFVAPASANVGIQVGRSPLGVAGRTV